MNAVRFDCSDGTQLIPYEGVWGVWSTDVTCLDGFGGAQVEDLKDFLCICSYTVYVRTKI